MIITIKTNGDKFTGWWNGKIYVDKLYLTKPAEGKMYRNGTPIDDKTIMFNISALSAIIMGEDTEKVIERPTVGNAKATRKQLKDKVFKLPRWARYVCLYHDSAAIEGDNMIVFVERSIFGDMPSGMYNIIHGWRKDFDKIIKRIVLTGKSGVEKPDDPECMNFDYLREGTVVASCSLAKARAVLPFADTGPIKPAFNGVYFNGYYAASDSRRLAYLGEVTDNNGGYIMPYSFVKDAKHETIDFIETSNGTFARSGNLYAKVVDGIFPNVRGVIPKETNDSFEILPNISDALALTKAPTFKCSLINGKTFAGVGNIPFQFTAGVLPYNIGFNVSYLIDAVKMTGSTTVHTINQMSPMVIKGIDCDHPTAIIMPIQIIKGE